MVVFVTLLCLLAYLVGYRLYSRYLARRVFSLDAGGSRRRMPGGTRSTMCPTGRFVLFGHHYASITGLSPMLGPAVAVIWGWAPAMLWVVLGALFVGCVHDFGSLVVSMRARGMSIGKVTEGIVGRRAKSLFHLVIFFGIALAMGVFVYVIARAVLDQRRVGSGAADGGSVLLPDRGPAVGRPDLIALVAGHLLYRRK